MPSVPWKLRRKDAGPSLDGIRLALQAVRGATDLAAAFEQVCVGAARVSGAKNTALAFEQPAGYEVAAAVGRAGRSAAQARIRQLHLVDGREDGVFIVPLPTAIGAAVILAETDEAGAGASLALFAETAGALIDLYVLRDQAAAASHRVQPAENRTGLLASLHPGDAVAVITLDALDVVHRESGQIAVDSVFSALGVHLLNATRPPGDAVAILGDGTFLVVLRDLKAPVGTIAQRLSSTWNATRPTTTFSLGAALHLDHTPLDTFGQAEEALASARRRGGGQAHVAAPNRAS